MMGQQTTLLLILLFTPLLLAADVTLTADAQTTCAAGTGCDFNTASIWSTGAIPTNNDTVTISGASGLQLVTIFTANPTAVLSLFLTNAIFSVNKDNFTTIASLNVGVNATLIISETTRVESIIHTGTLYVDNTATLTANGILNWQAAAEIYGTVTYGANSVVTFFDLILKPSATSVFNTLFFFGHVVILDHSTITFAGGLSGINMTVQNTSTITVQKQLLADSISLDTASAFHVSNIPAGDATINGALIAPLSGTGSFILDSSSVVITSKAQTTFNGTVTLNLNSNINVSNVALTNPLTFGPAAAVTIYGNGLNIGGTTTIPGNVIATGQGVTISGTVTSNGVSAVSSSIAVPGSLVIPSTYLVALTNSTLSLGGSLQIDTLDIPVGSILNVISSKAILIIPTSVSLIVEGTLSASANNILEIHNGNYNQTATGTLAVGVTDDSTAPLSVPNGTISVAGSLQYSLADKPFVRTEHFLVASANSNTTVNGTFNGDASALPGSALSRSLGVEYSGNNIYVEYKFDVGDVEYWMWIVLAVGVVVIVAVIAGIVMKLRTRSKYEPVR